jgi:hypothetical protein
MVKESVGSSDLREQVTVYSPAASGETTPDGKVARSDVSEA